MKFESLKFEDLSFGHEGEMPLFEHVDFSFPMNETVWVRASSGAGRSSLLQLIAGLLIPQRGKYFINDVNVADMSFEEFLPYRLKIGYGFDMGGLLHNRTILENITLPLLYHKTCSKPEADDRGAEYLAKLNITKFANLRPSSVPGGVRKMTCLIRALMMEPELLLLDDPSVGLGQDQSLKYFDCVEALRKAGKTKHIFISSFDEQFMNCVPHKEIYIDSGTIYQDAVEGDKKAVSL
jgi:ABC-type transporter Mla maintaining outer membrane lipid asymmetry ATPase subunit MlaF